MRKIKILYVIDKLNVGGAQKYILQLLKNLDRNKFIPHLCCLMHGGSLIKEADLMDTKIFISNIKRIYGFSGISGMFNLREIIKKEKIDIVHTFLFSATITGNIAAKAAGTPLIISGRRDTGLHREGKWRHRQAYRFAYKLADKVFTVSNAVRDTVNKYEGVRLDKIITLYNGVIINRFNKEIEGDSKRKELGIGPGDKVVGLIANLNWVKGHSYFLEAAKMILEELPNTKFLLIGDGPLLQSYKSEVTSHKLEDKILFLGSRSDIPELLSIMDVSVNASYSEGMSNAILESMAAGKPVVATNVDGNKEVVVDGKTGFLIPVKDALAIKEKLIFLLRRPDIARQFGEEARRLIKKKFDTVKMVNELENTYLKLLKQKRNGYTVN